MKFMKCLVIPFFVILLSSCGITAHKDKSGKMYLDGFGAKYAKFPDGSEIGKQEPFSVPSSLGNNR